jgi:ribosomal protein L4
VLDMSQSQKKAAILSAYSAKAKAGEIVALRGISDLGKTSEVGKFIETLAKELKHNKFTFLLSDANVKTFRFFRNLKDATTVLYKNASAFDIIGAGMIVLDESIFEKKVQAKPASADASARRRKVTKK